MSSKKGKPAAGPVAGNFAPAPAGAPHETSKPLQGDALDQMLARAAQNEQQLQPLPPPGKPAAPVPAPPPAPVQDPPAEVPPTGEPEANSGAEAGTEGESMGDAGLDALASEFASVPAGPAPDLGHMGPRRPAESNTDSPSRGIPRPSLDPNKQVTGGWGGDGPGQYFALDGAEIQQIVQTLMADLTAQVARDLRFSLAIVYPQVRVRLTLALDGSSTDAAINDVAFDLKTARILALTALAMDDEDTPADAIRDQSGLDKPRKQTVRAGATTLMVDVPHKLAGQ